jgi:hypothetical protein
MYFAILSIVAAAPWISSEKHKLESLGASTGATLRATVPT